MSSLRRPRAFTLIELMIVISIIGLLSTLAAVALSSARAKSRDSKRAADLAQIRKGLEVSFVPTATDGYPRVGAAGITLGATGAKVLCNVSGVATFVDKASDCTGGGTVFMALVPSDPITTGKYLYKSTTVTGASCTAGACAGYCISTVLEKGLPQVGLPAGDIMADQAALKVGGPC